MLPLKYSVFLYNLCQKLYVDLSEKNIKFNAIPQKSPDGLVKVTFCNDPDGIPIELVEQLNSK